MKIPVKIPVKQQIPAGTGTGIKRPNPGRDPGFAGIPVGPCRVGRVLDILHVCFTVGG
jgi:hypothetical protein